MNQRRGQLARCLGHVSALKKHLKNKYFIHLDIQNFFGHINPSRVTRSLKKYFSYEKAREIALESTVRLPKSADKKYILPFGFVQSPIISSVCLSKSALGRFLSSLEKENDFSVSVYMDDILVSSNNLKKLNQQMRLIITASEKSGLPLNTKKQEGPSDSVTAFNICMAKGLLTITPSRIQEFINTLSISTNEYQHAGITSYVSSINVGQVNSLFTE